MSQEASSEPMPTEVIVPRNPCDTWTPAMAVK